MSPHRHLFVSLGNGGHFRAKVDFRALFAIREVVALKNPAGYMVLAEFLQAVVSL
jgi:hypothetical protein